MGVFSSKAFDELASAYAFLGNSLLAPLSQTSDAGLSPEFWEAFPDFENPDVAVAVASLADYARKVRARYGGDELIEACSVEYTHLFVGPPHPAAAPWESAYSGNGANPTHEIVGFGEPTFEMRRLLRELGLELHNENNQYEDHMGIELLYMSELCRRRAAAEGDCTDELFSNAQIAKFVREHPLAWIDSLVSNVHEAAPDGYFEHLLALVAALLKLSVSMAGSSSC